VQPSAKLLAYDRLAKVASVTDTEHETVKLANALVIGEANPTLAPKGADLAAGEAFATEVERREADGSRLTDRELLKLYKAARTQAVEAPGKGWNLDAYRRASDLSAATKVPALWGNADRLYVPATGRSGLLFGPDAAGKSTGALNVVAGALGAPGWGDLLGAPVNPLPADRGVLYFAIDGPEETAARLAGMTLDDGTPLRTWAGDRLGVWSGPLPWNDSSANDADLTALVERLETHTGQPFGLVVVDNAMRAYGDVSHPVAGDLAARSLNRLMARGGTAVLVITQSKKLEAPSTRNDALASAFLISGAGAIVSLHHPEKAPQGVGKLRHWKGYGADPTAVEYVTDLTTGRMSLGSVKAARAGAKADRFTSDLQPGDQYTKAELETITGLKPRTLERRLAEAIKAGTMERANPNEGLPNPARYQLTEEVAA